MTLKLPFHNSQLCPLQMDPNPALTHLYSCSRWSDFDPNKVIADYVRIGEETCEQLREKVHIEDLPYFDLGDTNTLTQVDIWGEVKDHLVIFIHGGFWQEGTRKVVSPAAVNLVKRSLAMAAVGYDYASPTHPLSKVVQQVVTATEVSDTQFLLSKYPEVKTVTLAGHSAGAQLAFRVAAQLRHPKIQRLILFAGVFDLKELPLCEIGAVIGMTPGEAKKGSCSASELEGLNIRVQILIAGKDSPKLIEQNRAMVSEMKEHGVSVDAHEFVDCDHFSIIHGLRHGNEKQTREFVAFLCDNAFSS
ncbi:hypothetical protein Y032_0059g2985 [Ancylostoma ceylanicum]|uniref:Alpha/beta hydrolase fold-3 domain-containing protein n=1 Tax=Ancylostoma ceylanicum TaxID=53326 RepID=A0A016U4A4_9BILA|nr:hypothetical protein Y032_0059g2985 [Ancylostoma ceylanicum]